MIKFFKKFLCRFCKELTRNEKEFDDRKDPACNERDYWEGAISLCFLLSVREIRENIINEEEDDE